MTHLKMTQLVLAQVSDLAAPVGQFLNILMLFGFVFGVAVVMSGALAIKRGDAENGKMAIIAGAILAAAPAIMKALFVIFKLNDALPAFK